MKPSLFFRVIALIGMVSMLLVPAQGIADDTCMFIRTADDIPPNIVFLMDNGPQMSQIVWHPDYDDSYDYTPVIGESEPSDPVDMPDTTAASNGFFNENGYALVQTVNNPPAFELFKVGADLQIVEFEPTKFSPTQEDGRPTPTTFTVKKGAERVTPSKS